MCDESAGLSAAFGQAFGQAGCHLPVDRLDSCASLERRNGGNGMAVPMLRAAAVVAFSLAAIGCGTEKSCEGKALMAYDGPELRDLGEKYCHITSPMEWLAEEPKAHTCERQHIIPRTWGPDDDREALRCGVDTLNVAWWPTSWHVRTDSWKGGAPFGSGDKAWLDSRPWLDFGLGSSEEARINLQRAYMMGTYGLTATLVLNSYDENKSHKSKFLFLEFDGMSNLLYGWAWLVNTPQKILNQFAYISDKGWWWTSIDLLLFAFLVWVVEALLLTVATVLGVTIGTLLNPWDTLVAIPSGLLLALETTVWAVFEYALGILRVIWSRWFGFVIVIPAVLVSAIPVLYCAKAAGK